MPRGQAHAEVIALRQAGQQAKGAVLVYHPGAVLPLWKDASVHKGHHTGGHC